MPLVSFKCFLEQVEEIKLHCGIVAMYIFNRVF